MKELNRIRRPSQLPMIPGTSTNSILHSPTMLYHLQQRPKLPIPMSKWTFILKRTTLPTTSTHICTRDLLIQLCSLLSTTKDSQLPLSTQCTPIPNGNPSFITKTLNTKTNKLGNKDPGITSLAITGNKTRISDITTTNLHSNKQLNSLNK